ncbi:MAG: hypothetical protein JWN32_1915 [Solirubrobacterales bacterium]|nr:hypothetical protein [Solirubrobacterales bacterium]
MYATNEVPLGTPVPRAGGVEEVVWSKPYRRLQHALRFVHEIFLPSRRRATL